MDNNYLISIEDGRNYTPDKENDCGWLSELVDVIGEDIVIDWSNHECC